MRMSQVGQIQRAAKDQADIQGKISSGHAKKMFEALTLMNRGKTPLHLAIDHDQLWLDVVRYGLPTTKVRTCFSYNRD